MESILPKTWDNKEELNDKQKLFVDLLFKNGGDVAKSLDEAGYKQGSRGYLIKRVADEIQEKAKVHLALHSAKAVNKLTQGLDFNGETPFIKTQIDAAQQVLDRTGLGKSEKVEHTGNVTHGVILLPDKDEPQIVDVTPNEGNG